MAIITTRPFDMAKYKLEVADPEQLDEGGTVKLVPLVSLELARYDGEEELAALDRAQMAMPSGRTPSGPFINEHQVAQAIVSVNGRKVERPYLRWRKWPADTRGVVTVAADRLNSVKRSTMEDFIKTEFGE